MDDMPWPRKNMSLHSCAVMLGRQRIQARCLNWALSYYAGGYESRPQCLRPLDDVQEEINIMTGSRADPCVDR